MKKWCVKTPRGRLEAETMRDQKYLSEWRGGSKFGNRYHDPDAAWQLLLREGYTVVRVTVEEVE